MRWGSLRAALVERASSNYRADLVVEDSENWTVAQRRERMFLIGTPAVGPGPVWTAAPGHGA